MCCPETLENAKYGVVSSTSRQKRQDVTENVWQVTIVINQQAVPDLAMTRRSVRA